VAVGEKKKMTGKNLVFNYLKAFKEIYTNQCSRWIIAGGCLRFWSGYTIGYFAPKYFNIYPEFTVSRMLVNNY
jgi:hypothetical protein